MILDGARLTLFEALEQVLDPQGKTIIDVGCGDGTIVRYLARKGAAVTGTEVNVAQLGRAREEARAGESYTVASAQSLPLADASADVILYIKSFHHVPRELMRPALEEAGRVLKPGGRLVVIEPLAQGGYFEAMRPLEDETEVRAAAHAELLNPPTGLTPDRELSYETVVRIRDASHFIENVIAADPARHKRLALVEDELRRRYVANVLHDAEGAYFLSLMRRNSFHRRA